MAYVMLAKCFSEPKYFLRLIAVIICLCVAFYQLSASIRKILHPPVSTHYTFKLNETMDYPSITICRNPGYKTNLFEKYGLPASAVLHYSGTWKDFKFDEYTLDEFFEEVTFELKDIIPFYGFDGYSQNVSVEAYLKLAYGKCFKLTANHEALEWDNQSGYLVYMKHSISKDERKYDRYNRISLAGYHVFIHEPSEKISDTEYQRESFMEYIYVEAGEDFSYNMRTNEYNQLPGSDNNCTSDFNYSRSMCIEDCIHLKVTKEIGCSTPWMEIDGLKRCNNYNDVKNMIVAYNAYNEECTNYLIDVNEFVFSGDSNKHLCPCVRSCNITIYIPYVQNRKTIELPTTVLSLYYTSNLVTIMEEVIGYDWNVFLADMGGSLGFLLGLSVLGIISTFEDVIKLMCVRKPKELKVSDENVDALKRPVEIYLNGERLDAEDSKYFEEQNQKNNIRKY